MKLEKQVVSLELAKQLKELGFEQESLFAWGKLPISSKDGYDGAEYGLFYEWELLVNKGIEIISAYTTSELGEMLPDSIEVPPRINNSCKLEAILDLEKFVIRYRCEGDSFRNIGMMGRTEADARAKCLIYLKENKLI